MKDLTKKILDKLPASWDEITLRQCIKLLILIPKDVDEFDGQTVGIENSIQKISALTDTSIQLLEELPLGDLIKLSSKIDFISVEPAPKKKGVIKWKTPDEITYNDFITFDALAKKQEKINLDYTPLIIKTFSKNELTDDEILNLPMGEVFTGFFLHKRLIKKFHKGMLRSLRWKMSKEKIMNWFKRTPCNLK